MYTDIYQHTATEVTYKGGEKTQTCGIACLMRLINDNGGPDAFEKIMVRGWSSKEQIDATKAYYVIGSKIVPDMLPNLIAFINKDAAIEFQKENGGEVLSFTQAMLSVSPMGMTMPVKVQSAAVPAKGATGVGAAYMYMVMDEIKEGTSSSDPLTHLQTSGKMMGKKEMRARSEMAMVSYGITDNLAMNLKIGQIHKRMEMYTKKGAGVSVSENSGFSDLDLTMRYNLWRNSYYSKFFTILGGITVPTGEFETAYIARSGLQTGTGDFTGTAGVVYSQRAADFWFHTMLTYTHKLENNDNYRFGDETRIGAALHYTPNYNLMVGIELNGTNYAGNEYNGIDVGDSGGFRSYATGVINWRFLTIFGGNLNLRLASGLPIYENMDGLQMGGGYYYNGVLSFKRRLNFM